MNKNLTGVALVTVIVFILLLSIIAIAMLNLMTNQALLTEHQIKRIKAQYVAEAGFWKNFMHYFLGQPPPPPVSEEGMNAVVTRETGTGPGGTDTINAKVTY
ncbi:MAG: PilX N-terminal domain-containing pilus assembly protein [Candidatus Omnitrophota bacterium]|nr:PilX N-terminal domain-containing pilus assembly protein [Candidatus Omnitrophota bacterium]